MGVDLDDQIYKTFQDVGAVTEHQVQAENGEHLRQLLQEDHRNIFTLILASLVTTVFWKLP